MTKERPILFSAPMVAAILDGRKTQTRRVIKPLPHDVVTYVGADNKPYGEYGLVLDADYPSVIQKRARSPYGCPGDRLWVRENFTIVPATAYRMSEGVHQTVNPNDKEMAAIYATGWDRSIPKWKPSIHMPRWASRILLEIISVRVERLQDCSAADVLAEGAPVDPYYYDTSSDGSCPHMVRTGPAQWCTPRLWYHRLWDEINGKDAWDANPWIWVVEFKRVEA